LLCDLQAVIGALVKGEIRLENVELGLEIGKAVGGSHLCHNLIEQALDVFSSLDFSGG
jgi:hypothetical protein